MKKRKERIVVWFSLFGGVAVATSLFFAVNYAARSKHTLPIDETVILADLQLIDETKTDSNLFREKYSLEAGRPFIWWYRIDSLAELEGYQKEFFLDFSKYDVDFKDNTLLFSIGSPLESVEYHQDQHFGPGAVLGYATFSEEYKDDIMYIYVMEPVGMVPPELDHGGVFKMIDGERVFIGSSVYHMNPSINTDNDISQ
ncbi:hypothetical protein LJC32_03130 [Oscillospiraceae bacterium OttesenSCG-928-F05]|nr:hypothetical protein [Oscillospiraceae bacterium OttesenSCG-928-F05]